MLRRAAKILIIKNIQFIALTEIVQDLLSDSSSGSTLKFMETLPKLIRHAGDSGESALNNPKVKKMMAEESFDLVIVGFFMQNFLLGVADHFKCPSIVLSSGGPMTVTNVLVGNPLAVSGVPNIMLQYKEPMKFFQRVKNFLIYTIEYGITQYTEMVSKQYYE